MQRVLDFYTQPSTMTSAGSHSRRFDGLPRDVPGLVRVVQGLLLHEHWAPAYGAKLSDELGGGSLTGLPIAHMATCRVLV